MTPRWLFWLLWPSKVRSGRLGDVLGQHRSHVPLAGDPGVIDALAPDAFKEALEDGVGVRRPYRRENHCAARGAASVPLVLILDRECLVQRLARPPLAPGRRGQFRLNGLTGPSPSRILSGPRV